jgi:methylated-DNA-protein-cysteine methyltransferase-like protein
MKKEEFFLSAYEIVKMIPSGKVTTYGTVAQIMGRPQCSRMVGQAMHYADFFTEAPCHRVVNCQGRLVPDWKEQGTLLKREGVRIKENGCVDLKAHLWQEPDRL